MTATTPAVSPRVLELHARMTREEKLAQLVGYWVDQGEETVAPMSGELQASQRYETATTHGLGHLTRVYGTRPVDAVERARWLWREQERLRERSGHGIGAIVHEECLTGLAAWGATIFPTPLAWGAAFDPDLVEETARAIGSTLRGIGVHQGLAPVLDVARDPRWGRTDECIAEDPYLVGTVGTAYVRGLQESGIHATLKHFVGYSASQAGRNHAPVHAGPREIADVFLPPFEMAVRDGGVRSVMNSYSEIDGVPVAASPYYLTEVLRERWGFDGVVVADYFSIAFLHMSHAVAADRGEAAGLALAAGIDVELPSGDTFAEPLAEALAAGMVDEALVDRAVLRVLAQKEELGLLDPPTDEAPTAVDLDPPAHRELARRLAESSLVLLSNDGLLPLADRAPQRLAVIGPNADRPEAMLGCYSFVNHVLAHHPGVPLGVEIPSVAEALRAELGEVEVTTTPGCDVDGDDTSGIPAAVAAAEAADVAVVVVGDQAGLFGRGTVGEGNDVESLELPGAQRQLVEAVVATSTPVVLVLLTGRPYAIGWALDGETSAAAVLQSFFPGQMGGPAIARVLAGTVAPSGRLPITMPRSAGAQPYSYLRPALAGSGGVSSADTTPVRPFGFGLTYTTFERTDLRVPAEVATDGSLTATVTVTNTGERTGVDVVQLYGHDVHASVTRPAAQLLGYRRVELEPGESAEVTFTVPTSLLALTDPGMTRVVEPGDVELWVGGSCEDKEAVASTLLVGDVHRVTAADGRVTTSAVTRPAEVSPAAGRSSTRSAAASR